jgi:eukaryotic translation initiation factor 2C
VRQLSEREARGLSRALRKIEVITTHRVDRKKPIFGISSQPVDATMVEINGKEVSVADYFQERYKMKLRHANLPAVNIGSARRPTWLPIEVCEVAPGQRCANINDLDTAEIIKQTSQKPNVRADNVMEQVRNAGFENDPYLAAFGMKVDLRMESVEAKVLETPEVQYLNISERPLMGSWNLKDRQFVEGAVLSNWGVVVHASLSERDVMRLSTRSWTWRASAAWRSVTRSRC